MTVVQNVTRDPAGNPIPRTLVIVELVTGSTDLPGYLSDATVISRELLRADETGAWSANVAPNSTIIPTSTHYRVTEVVGGQDYVSRIVVPADGGPHNLTSLLVTDPPEPDPLTPVGGGAVVSVDGRVGAVSLSDRYATVGHNHNGVYSATGHNHDASYSATAHNHDAAYAPAAHNHDATYSPLGHSHPYATAQTYNGATYATVAGQKIYVGSAVPQAPADGDIWFDTTGL